MNITFLDRKLISDIRSHLTMRTTQGIDMAKQIDDEAYTPSVMLSLFNEKILKGMRTQDLIDTEFKDFVLLTKFYKKTQTDVDFLKTHRINLVTPFCNQAERRLSECLPFIWFTQQQLASQEKITNKESLRDQLFALSEKHQIERGNPLLIMALAALYGQPQAQKIFEDAVAIPKKNEAFSDAQLNIIDIFLLPELVSIYSKQMWSTSDMPASINYTMLTASDAVNEFINALQISGHPALTPEKESVECAFDMQLTTDLFPDIENNPQLLGELISLMTAPPPSVPTSHDEKVIN